MTENESRANLKEYYPFVAKCKICKQLYGKDVIDDPSKDICPECLSSRVKRMVKLKTNDSGASKHQTWLFGGKNG